MGEYLNPTLAIFISSHCPLKISLSEIEVKLESPRLRLHIQFKKVLDAKKRKWVQLPSDCSQMFYESSSIIEIGLEGASSLRIENASNMFAKCTNLKNIKFGDSFSTWKINNMNRMFFECKCLTELDFSKFNTINVKNMENMFNGCYSLKDLDLSNFDMSKVTGMGHMFEGCDELKHLTLGNKFIVRHAKDMRHMFSGCVHLSDISGFNISNIEGSEESVKAALREECVFDHCPAGEKFL